MIVKLLYQAHRDYDAEAVVFVTAVLLVVLLIVRRNTLRDSYPAYNEIPGRVLAHMPSKEELKELQDHPVDVVVS